MLGVPLLGPLGAHLHRLSMGQPVGMEPLVGLVLHFASKDACIASGARAVQPPPALAHAKFYIFTARL